MRPRQQAQSLQQRRRGQVLCCCDCLLDTTSDFSELSLVWFTLCKLDLGIEAEVPVLCGSCLLFVRLSTPCSRGSSCKCIGKFLPLLLRQSTCCLLQLLGRGLGDGVCDTGGGSCAHDDK